MEGGGGARHALPLLLGIIFAFLWPISQKLHDFWPMLWRQYPLSPFLPFSHYAADPGWRSHAVQGKKIFATAEQIFFQLITLLQMMFNFG